MNRYIRSLFFASLLILWAHASYAQGNIARDTTHYNDEELYSTDLTGTPGYSWIGGGLILGMHLPSLTDFNSMIAQPFIHQNLKEQGLFIGGQGFMPLPWVKNLRIGGLGMSGSSNICCVPDTTTLGQPVMRSLTYHIGYGALTLDYAVLNLSRFHILAGTEIGLGDLEIIAQQAANRNSFDIGSEFNSPSTNITHTYHAGMIVIKPQIEFEYAPLKWLMTRLAAGYQITSIGKWSVDDGVTFGDSGALAKVNGNGVFFHLGVFVGFF